MQWKRVVYVHRRIVPSRCNQSRFFSDALLKNEPKRLVDKTILDHLVCPISKYPLSYDVQQGVLICKKIHVSYPVRHGVPILVPAEGQILQDDEE